MNQAFDYKHEREACILLEMSCSCRDYKEAIPLCRRCIAVRKVAVLLKIIDTYESTLKEIQAKLEAINV